MTHLQKRVSDLGWLTVVSEKGDKVSVEQVNNLEKEIGFTIPEDFKYFLIHYSSNVAFAWHAGDDSEEFWMKNDLEEFQYYYYGGSESFWSFDYIFRDTDAYRTAYSLPEDLVEKLSKEEKKDIENSIVFFSERNGDSFVLRQTGVYHINHEDADLYTRGIKVADNFSDFIVGFSKVAFCSDFVLEENIFFKEGGKIAFYSDSNFLKWFEFFFGKEALQEEIKEADIKEKSEEELDGDYLRSLLSKPSDDPEIIALVNKIGTKKIPKYRSSIDEFYIDLLKKRGFLLDFDDERYIKSQKDNKDQVYFLNSIELEYNFPNLPFGLVDTDDEKSVREKINKDEHLYKSEDGENILFYFIKEENIIIYITFEDDEREEIYSVLLRTYQKPSSYGAIKYITG